MKVTNKMIAKDLRIKGQLYKQLVFIPKKRRMIKINKHRTSNIMKPTFNAYIKRKDGSQLRLLIKKPKKDNVPSVLWLHGGGYALGMPEMISMSQCKHLIGECLIVAPDYTLSVEKPFPAALEDAYLSLEWLVEHCETFGGNKNQIFVGGESAGGGLCIALCLLARDKGKINIAYQMPLYPMLDNRPTESMKDNNAPVWNEIQNRAAWQLYLEGEKDTHKYAVPAREENYSSLPPVCSFVGSIEPFRDETITYINHLKECHIPTYFKIFEGCFHAFDMMAPNSHEAKEANQFFKECFNYATTHYFKENT